jgi:hypothetical protein
MSRQWPSFAQICGRRVPVRPIWHSIRSKVQAKRNETNWLSYATDSMRLSSFFGKRTGWVKAMTSQDLILKMLKSFIRSTSPASINEFGVEPRETNWMGYHQDFKLLSSILGKRTGWVKAMSRQHLILKILKSFIRCHQQFGWTQARVRRPQWVLVCRNLIEDLRTNLGSRLESAKKRSECFPSMNWKALAAAEGYEAK